MVRINNDRISFTALADIANWRTEMSTEINPEFTTSCSYSWEQAKRLAKAWCKDYNEYNTTITDLRYPAGQYWYVTNKYDPKVRARQASLEKS